MKTYKSHVDNPAKGFPEYVRQWAQENKVDPFFVMNDLTETVFGVEFSPETRAYAELIDKLTPLPVDFKLNNSYRYVPQRNHRAFSVPSGGRGKFAGQVFSDQLTQSR